MQSADEPVPAEGKTGSPRRQFPIGPLAWIILTPLVTLPATLIATVVLTPFDGRSYPTYQAVQAAAESDHLCKVTLGDISFFGGVDASAACPDGYVLAALSPGLLNLTPVLWLLFGRPSVRRTAIIATVLGAARFLIPVVAVFVAVPTDYSGTIPPGFTLIKPSSPWSYPNSWNDASLFTFVLWTATVIVYFAGRFIARRRRRSADANSVSRF